MQPMPKKNLGFGGVVAGHMSACIREQECSANSPKKPVPRYGELHDLSQLTVPPHYTHTNELGSYFPGQWEKMEIGGRLVPCI